MGVEGWRGTPKECTVHLVFFQIISRFITQYFNTKFFKVLILFNNMEGLLNIAYRIGTALASSMVNKLRLSPSAGCTLCSNKLNTLVRINTKQRQRLLCRCDIYSAL